MYSAVILFAAAMFCAVESWVGLAVAFFALGIISGVATWALGFAVRSDAAEEEWMNAIR
ncbi:hypothetical protein [Arthrobacter sp. AL12]|uniref:hypothetical protein n=1 Tax=Arthrobacter sp. AL12 TaxID=3042241 RepID=UPI00249BDC26|nr:hypothetical protein [Arthrobacter sp. AL12]MDI3213829.1 hypothetical protein [Arthrobacter sp. AL12]